MKTNVQFVIISRRIILGMRNVSDKILQKVQNHILCSITFFFPKIVFFMR